MPQRTRTGQPRNTAPMWKKLTIVLSAPVSVLLVISIFKSTAGWGFFPHIALIVVVAGAAVWGTARLLGVHLGLSSWD